MVDREASRATLPRRARVAVQGPASGERRLQLQGKTVLVTGASSGIGRACAVRFARHGAKLVLTGRNPDALEETSLACGGGLTIAADLTQPDSLSRLCAQVLEEVPALDVLVHNAGVGIYAPAHATDPDAAKRLVELNFLAPVEVTRLLLPKMRTGGSIVLVNSIAGKTRLPGLGVYGASKHALLAWADILRMDLLDRDIHVMNFCPGYVATPFGDNMLQSAVERPRVSPRIALTAEQCAKAIHRGLVKRKRTIVIPRVAWAFVAAERLVPGALYRLLPRLTRRATNR